MEQKNKVALYRINSIVGVVFQLSVLYSIIVASIHHKKNLVLLLATLLYAFMGIISLPFNWDDLNRRVVSLIHISIQIVMIAFLLFSFF